MIYSLLIIIFWIVFSGYWLISARGVKKDVNQKNVWLQYFWWRLLIALALYGLLTLPALHSFWRFWGKQVNPVLGVLGVLLCGGGIGLAVWARRHLGANWSPAPAEKENHELVTSGPYKFLRHPIYTGMLAGMLGSALANSAAWLVIAAAASIMFVYRIKVEEQIMFRLFPSQYSEYKKRTWALIPFIF